MAGSQHVGTPRVKASLLQAKGKVKQLGISQEVLLMVATSTGCVPIQRWCVRVSSITLSGKKQRPFNMSANRSSIIRGDRAKGRRFGVTSPGLVVESFVEI